jgi:soluble lytic murein transglycosylase
VATLPGESDYAEGRKAENLARYGDANAAYQSAAAQGGALQGYALVRAAVCRAMGGDVPGGLAELEDVITSSDPAPWTSLAQYELGLLLARETQVEKAAPYLLPILRNRAQLWWLEPYRWKAADYLIERPRPSPAAFEFFRGVVDSTLYRARRRDAAGRLEKSGVVDMRLDAATGFLRSRAHREAGKILLGIAVGGSSNAAVADRIALLSGRLLIAQGQRAAGKKVLERLLQDYPTSPTAPAALLDIAESALRAGQPGEAEEALMRLSADYSDAKEVGDTLWKMAQHFESKGQRANAVIRYADLSRRYPRHTRADDAQFQIGRLRMSAGEVEGAISGFDELAARFPQSALSPQGVYLAGSLLVGKNDDAEAFSRFELGGRLRVGDYYAHRSQERAYLLAPEKIATRNLRADGITSFVRPLTLESSLEAADPVAFPDDARFQRLAFFGARGMAEAEWEALGLAEALEAAPDAGPYLAAMSAAGTAYTAIQYANQLGWGRETSGLPTPDRYRLDYPRPYWQAIMRAARHNELDPYLLLAVARQESTYRPALTSSAGARGVMQVMPATARWLRKIEPAIDHSHIEDMNDPRNSIHIGSIYLQRMVERSEGNLVYALASYNGGPGNCDKWRRRFGTDDMAEFIEKIPFSETKKYVKRVLGNYAAYHSLYPPIPPQTQANLSD